jgi:hypothetical protein
MDREPDSRMVQTLRRPSPIAPPNWVFGPVWTLLYALMAIAAWRVWLAAPSAIRTWGLVLFLVQLALNFAWSWIFFRQHAIGAALFEVVFLWAFIGATTLVFAAVLPFGGSHGALLGMGHLCHCAQYAGFWLLNRPSSPSSNRNSPNGHIRTPLKSSIQSGKGDGQG